MCHPTLSLFWLSLASCVQFLAELPPYLAVSTLPSSYNNPQSAFHHLPKPTPSGRPSPFPAALHTAPTETGPVEGTFHTSWENLQWSPSSYPYFPQWSMESRSPRLWSHPIPLTDLWLEANAQKGDLQYSWFFHLLGFSHSLSPPGMLPAHLSLPAEILKV